MLLNVVSGIVIIFTQGAILQFSGLAEVFTINQVVVSMLARSWLNDDCSMEQGRRSLGRGNNERKAVEVVEDEGFLDREEGTSLVGTIL